MGKICDLNRLFKDSASAQYDQTIKTLASSAVVSWMGREEDVALLLGNDTPLKREALASWTKARNNLINHLMDVIAAYGVNGEYDPGLLIDSLKTDIQRQSSIYGDPELLWKNPNPRRMLAISKYINNLIHLKRTRWGKKLPMLERAFLPIHIFASRIDPTGHIVRFVDHATSLMERTRNRMTPHNSRYSDTMAKYMESVSNVLDGMSTIPSSYVMDGFVVKWGDEGQEGLFLGTNADGTHKVKISDTKTIDLPSETFSKDYLTGKLKEKYVYEFTNDIMHGQARYVEWSNDPTPEHRKEISRILREWKHKKSMPTEMSAGIKGLYDLSIGETKFSYVLLPAEASPGLEKYIGYIVQHESDGKTVYYLNEESKNDRMSIEHISSMYPSMFKNGWYKANKFKTYGHKYNENEKGESWLSNTTGNTYRERGYSFKNIHTLYMNQPPDALVYGYTGQISSGTLGQTISELRSMYQSIGNDIHKEVTEERDKIEKYLEGNAKQLRQLFNITDALSEREVLDKFLKMFEFGDQVWVTKEGEVITPNSTFGKMKDNYAPIVYHPADVMKMLEDAIAVVQNNMMTIEGSRTDANAKEVDQKLQELSELVYSYQAKLDKLIGDEDLSDMNTREILGRINLHAKHRVDYTDPILRRRDPGVHSAYLERVYYNIEKNSLMLEAIDTLINLRKVNVPINGELMHWVTNRLKVAFHDPSAEGGIGNVDYSYSTLADMVNKWLPGEHNYDAKSMEKFIMSTKGLLSGALLGANGALSNRTQFVNGFIHYGAKAMYRSMRIIYGKDPQWSKEKVDKIIENTGIDEVVNIFMDLMAHGGDLKLADAGLLNIPLLPVQLPTSSFNDYLRMGNLGRKKIIESKIPRFDGRINLVRLDLIKSAYERFQAKREAVLEKLQDKDRRYVEKQLAIFEREESRLGDTAEKLTVQKVKELFLDVIMTPKEDNNKSNLERKFKALLGNISDTRLRRMIGWKLSWWFGEGWGKELFTFTEGERVMRKQMAIMALLSAAESGILGDTSKMSEYTIEKEDGTVSTIKIPSVFMSPKAVRIARNAVTNTMFGMSQLHLGDAFIGAGQQLFLYKSYPWQQMLHDWRVTSDFMNSSLSWTDMATRLAKATNQLLNLKVKKGGALGYTLESKRGTYNPSDPNLDHQAIAMLRFVMTRMAMTMFSVAIEATGMFSKLVRTPVAKQMSFMMRGGENPIFAIAARILVNLAIFAHYDDDEANENALDVSWDIIRLLFPVFLTLPINIIMNWVED